MTSSDSDGGFLFKKDQSLDGVESYHAALVRRVQLVIDSAEIRETTGLRAQSKNHYAVYCMTCSLPARGCHPRMLWKTEHRYSTFFNLRQALIKLNPKAFGSIPWPPRRWISGSCNKATMRERKKGLQKFLCDAMQACCTDQEAHLIDDFLEVKEHDRPPPPSRVGVPFDKLRLDTLHNNTTEDIEFTRRIRRHDSTNNLSKMKKREIDTVLPLTPGRAERTASDLTLSPTESTVSEGAD
eukprot:CAMPEP_0181294722 /NCGR_PEP_ID=MMETSP1101-20121128/3760_1 /TAXON_ID=46948 /ORGANISM="Rhodomonas abbreviata, Strain Caron Lab Isolate" /LENGTH=239 /DNA_ID=CAMNT_0023399415 /DNA_START=200 /DNA_END=919 /DNA_ORIENTATION=-